MKGGLIMVNKGMLTPFDSDLIAMIENLLKAKVEVYFEEGYIKLHVSTVNVTIKEIAALEAAVKGRTGERFINFEVSGITANIRFDSSKEQWPQEVRYDLVEPMLVADAWFERKPKGVSAVRFTRVEIDRVVTFTGGGTLTIPIEEGGRASYEFPTENGTLMRVLEQEFILLEKGHFTVMDAKSFLTDFEAK